MPNILEVENLSKTFPRFSLQKISFSLAPGYIMGFIGPNGAGKSTTLKLIMHLLHKDSGQIKIFGLDPQHYERQIKDRIGFVYDENHFYEELTLKAMARIMASCYSHWEPQTFTSYLEQFSLPPKEKIKKLSWGMQMKFSLALALSHQAELLILDEPTSGLDPIIRHELIEILSALREDEKKAVLFSTHITTDLEQIADYITFIHDGQLVFSRAKDDILERYALVKGDPGLLTRENQSLFTGWNQTRYGFTGLVPDRAQARLLLGNRVLFEKATLDDIMLYTVRGKAHV
ncbi:Putative ABC transporter [Acididesulfobacillus acetoxydans]|uniref:ABC transporter n=1 Tax=Acididesulfobacillus acetoxydans TaxID=1561005 RepID=A0A8S0WA09_9FIRM|nr:ABC transporter ATP-binding protein [Acididesulfobacillus acetoxydans]CAA7603039.1 Putative ABC transporter [Acididesulfobacillus acetoxydans]CEJ08998.1 ABC transporter protein [Acididesulfobacillus acetoxydans]